MITGIDQQNRPAAEDFKNYLEEEFSGKPVFMAEYRFKDLLDQSGGSVGKEVLGQKLYGFCGLAEPGGFLQTISEQGASLFGFSVFPDHHPYTATDLDNLVEAAGNFGCDALLTSEKDMVKLKELPCRMPLYALSVELDLPASFNNLLLSV